MCFFVTSVREFLSEWEIMFFCDGSSASGIAKVWKQSTRRSETATAGVATVLFPATGSVIVGFSAFSSSLTPQIYGINLATGSFSATYDQQWQR